MRPLFLSLAALAGVACAPVGAPTGGTFPAEPSGPPRVAFVAAGANQVTITMTDRARCVGLRPEGTNSGWSGTTTDCAYQLPYSVEFRTAAPPGRFGIEEGFGIGQGPRAEIYVTDTDGVRKLFLASLGSNVSLEVAAR